MNHFTSPAAARYYVQGRPYFHPWVRDAIRNRLPGGFRFERGLDVACGTGLSTRMLADLADHVLGVDLSESMLAHAYRAPNIEYKVGAAEDLPVPDSSFDVLTVALALHWFDRPRFLAEARRVLKPAGKMILYNHWFAGEMASNPRFGEWHAQVYLPRYAPPKRDSTPFQVSEATQAGFREFNSESFQNYWPFTPTELVSYFTSQSNVISVVQSGRETEEEITSWILAQLVPFWTLERETFRFSGSIISARNGKNA